MADWAGDCDIKLAEVHQRILSDLSTDVFSTYGETADICGGAEGEGEPGGLFKNEHAVIPRSRAGRGDSTTQGGDESIDRSADGISSSRDGD